MAESSNAVIKDFSEIISLPISAWIACAVLVFTLILVVIDIQRRSKATTIKACFNLQCLIYAAIFWVGNYFSSIFSIIPFRADIQEGNLLGFVMISSFSGVFAFKGILTNLDITFYKKGFLTIETWIEYALFNAVEKTTSKDIDIREKRLKSMLSGLPESELNAYITSYIGKDRVKALEQEAASTGSDAKIYKMVALINQPQDITNKIINQIKT